MWHEMPSMKSHVIANVQYKRQIASPMTTRLDTATAYLAHLLLRDTRPNTQAKPKEPNASTLFNQLHSST
jgi:hypothetical protein